ncbi:MAG: hypothetical protein P8X70_00765 [Nanoarchaeota archaeon]
MNLNEIIQYRKITQKNRKGNIICQIYLHPTEENVVETLGELNLQNYNIHE